MPPGATAEVPSGEPRVEGLVAVGAAGGGDDRCAEPSAAAIRGGSDTATATKPVPLRVTDAALDQVLSILHAEDDPDEEDRRLAEKCGDAMTHPDETAGQTRRKKQPGTAHLELRTLAFDKVPAGPRFARFRAAAAFLVATGAAGPVICPRNEATAEAHEARTQGTCACTSSAAAPAPAPAHPLHRLWPAPGRGRVRGPGDGDDHHVRPRLELPLVREVHAAGDGCGEGARPHESAREDGGRLALTSSRRS